MSREVKGHALDYAWRCEDQHRARLPSRQAVMGDVQPRGSLQLLSDSGDIEVARFQIKKETTTLGRALTNDVRLLLEDVSRKHCKIQFDS